MKMYKPHSQVLADLLENTEFKAAYEEEERKERLQHVLAAWRDNASLTRTDVARIMGVNPSTVTRMENNINKASLETIARYAKACGIKSATITI